MQQLIFPVFLAGIAFGCLLGFMLSLSSTGHSATVSDRAKAVEAGVGYYELNNKTGVVEFKYLNRDEYTAYIAAQLQQHMKGRIIQ